MDSPVQQEYFCRHESPDHHPHESLLRKGALGAGMERNSAISKSGISRFSITPRFTKPPEDANGAGFGDAGGRIPGFHRHPPLVRFQSPGREKLQPVDPKLRKEAAEWEDRFDEELGVAGRLWMYTYMLHDLPLILRYSRMHGVPRYETGLMPLLFPFVKGKIHKILKLTPASREDSKKIVDRIFDDVAEKAFGRPQISRRRFIFDRGSHICITCGVRVDLRWLRRPAPSGR